MIKAAEKARAQPKNSLEIARRVLTIEADAVRGLIERLDDGFLAAVNLISGIAALIQEACSCRLASG